MTESNMVNIVAVIGYIGAGALLLTTGIMEAIPGADPAWWVSLSAGIVGFLGLIAPGFSEFWRRLRGN
jgi:hypothetical protein